MATDTLDARQMLALDAAEEIGSISDALQARFEQGGEETLFVRGLAIRLEDLAGVILSAVGDPRDTPDSIAVRLYGPAFMRRELREARHAKEKAAA
jgi:hypothetical protein